MGEAQDYGYLYGRISGLMGGLLAEQDLEGLRKSTGPAEFLSTIKESSYSDWFTGVDASELGFRGERLLHKAFKETIESLIGDAPEKHRRDYRLVYESRWDTVNIKALLSGIHHGLPASEVKEMFTFLGSIDLGLFESMADYREIEDVVAQLPDPYKGMLEPVLEEYLKTRDLRILEERLDHGLLEYWMDNLRGKPRTYARIRVDVWNILYLFRCRLNDTEPDEYLILEGRYFTRKNLDDFYENGLEGLVEGLSMSPYWQTLSEVDLEDPDLSGLTGELEARGGQILHDSFIENPISGYSLIYFLDLKKKEVKKIRIYLSHTLGGVAG